MKHVVPCDSTKADPVACQTPSWALLSVYITLSSQGCRSDYPPSADEDTEAREG